MKILVYSTKRWVQEFFTAANTDNRFTLKYTEARLQDDTAALADGYDGVCVFVNDNVDAKTIETLAHHGVKLIALRCAGFNNVDLRAAANWKIQVVRVPAYSPFAVAEHAVALLLTLNRKLHRAYGRVREGNFALDGLMGFDLNGKTVGVVGTGAIGSIFARIMLGFGCNVIATDQIQKKELLDAGVTYVPITELYQSSDIVCLHCPLTPDTHHLVNETTIAEMKPGVTIVNTSRGALVNSLAVIEGLKSGRIGGVALDVYEEESDLFFEDLSDEVIQDDVFVRLQTFPNVLITAHQAFFTREAVSNIANTTLKNIEDFLQTGSSENTISAEEGYR
jgi:D-lactate dehydrogenase